MTANVRRRPEREPVDVVVDGTTAHVVGVDVDTVQLVALSAGIVHEWDRVASRWTFRAVDALTVGAALRASGRTVRLASGTQNLPDLDAGKRPRRADQQEEPMTDHFDEALAAWRAMTDGQRAYYRGLGPHAERFADGLGDVPTDTDGLPLHGPDDPAAMAVAVLPGGYDAEELDQGFPYGEDTPR